MNKRILSALSIIIFLGYIAIGCGTKGKIKGTVTDGSGEVVPDIIVTATPGEYQAITDENGKYLIEDLTTGEYVVTASSDGLSGTGTANIDFSGFNCTEVECNIMISTSVMVLIPAGNFSMGSTVEVDEQPVHTIYLDTYYIDKYEVTNCLYKVFIDGGGYDNSAYWTTDGWTWKTNNSITQPYYWDDSTFGYNATDGPNLPVVGVSWYEAYAYANWAGKRLPTEAEWEKAARGTDERPYPWGEGIDSSKLNYNDNIGHTTVVGSYETGKSPYGCYDMAGNVWEWCNDWYDASYYSSSPTNNPQGPGTGATRVFRGGSWNYDDNNCRSANRNWYYPNYRDYGFGFRCASGVVQ